MSGWRKDIPAWKMIAPSNYMRKGVMRMGESSVSRSSPEVIIGLVEVYFLTLRGKN